MKQLARIRHGACQPKRAGSLAVGLRFQQDPMQGRIANAVLKFRYTDGKEERLELEHPSNFWSLTQLGKTDYDYELDGFSLPVEPPTQVRLGADCRAMVYGWKLRPGAILKEVTLDTLSHEVVIGLTGVSVMAGD